MLTANIHEAKTNLSKLIEQAERGEEVIIARDNKPVVRLVPIEQPPAHRVPGLWKGRFEIPDSFFDPLPQDELDAWGQ